MGKKEVIKELRETAKKLKKSPGRREINPRLYKNCLKHFKYFNDAKKSAKLKIIRRKCIPLPKKAYRLDKNLVHIAAYLTTDGHLYKDLKGFYLSCKDLKTLEYFEKIVYKKFNLKGKYYLKSEYNGANIYKVFDVNTSRLLNSLEIPAGNKVLINFDVPSWIKNNKQFAKEYLKVCFYCEGSKFKKSKDTETIRIRMHKSEKLFKDGIKFMTSLKSMLKMFNVTSSPY